MPATLAPAPAAEQSADPKATFAATMAAAAERADNADSAPAEIPADDDASQSTEVDSASEQDPLPAADPKPQPEVPPADELADPLNPTPTTPDEPAKPTAPAGPTREWLEFALQQNVPRELLKHAVSDEQIQAFILDFGDPLVESPAGPTEAQQAAAALKLQIKDEDFDPTDPVHLSLKEIVETQNKALAELRDELKSLRGATGNLVQERTQQELVAKTREFDAVADAFNAPELGASMSDQRKASYALFDVLEKTSPNVPRAELMRRAILATHPTIITKQATAAQLAALKTQQEQTIGGGPAKPAPKHTPTSRETFLAFLDEKEKKAREAGL